MLFRRQRLFFKIVFFDREETPQQVKVHRRWLRDARNGLEFFREEERFPGIRVDLEKCLCFNFLQKKSCHIFTNSLRSQNSP